MSFSCLPVMVRIYHHLITFTAHIMLGIWDCLSSQQVVDSIRRMVHDSMELSDICESLMGICLSPYSSTITGCDNMTVIIIALLNGRSKEEWYAWVKDRVARRYGYDTPVELPRIFSSSGDAMIDESHDESNDSSLRFSAGPLGGLARALPHLPISFHPGPNENDDDTLEFQSFNVDEDSDEETAPSTSFLELASLGRSKEELTELLAQLRRGGRMNREDNETGGGSQLLGRDGDLDMSEPDENGAGAIRRHLGEPSATV